MIRRWWPPLARGRDSHAHATFWPGSGSYPDSGRPTANRARRGSQNAATQAPDPRRACCHDPALRDPHHTRQMGLRGLLARAHANTVVVALANKLARIAWAVLRTGRGFEAREVRGARSCRCRYLTTQPADRADPARCGRRSLRVVGVRWPDSRTATWNPVGLHGA